MKATSLPRTPKEPSSLSRRLDPSRVRPASHERSTPHSILQFPCITSCSDVHPHPDCRGSLSARAIFSKTLPSDGLPAQSLSARAFRRGLSSPASRCDSSRASSQRKLLSSSPDTKETLLPLCADALLEAPVDDAQGTVDAAILQVVQSLRQDLEVLKGMTKELDARWQKAHQQLHSTTVSALQRQDVQLKSLHAEVESVKGMEFASPSSFLSRPQRETNDWQRETAELWNVVAELRDRDRTESGACELDLDQASALRKLTQDLSLEKQDRCAQLAEIRDEMSREVSEIRRFVESERTAGRCDTAEFEATLSSVCQRPPSDPEDVRKKLFKECAVDLQDIEALYAMMEVARGEMFRLSGEIGQERDERIGETAQLKSELEKLSNALMSAGANIVAT